MTIDIQLLTAANAPMLKHTAADVFDFEIREDYLTDFLNDPRHIMYVALDNSLVVGMVSAVEYFHPDKPMQLWINELGVGTEFRCQGIGRALTSAIIEHAKSRGIEYIWVGTEQSNLPAQRCFSSITDVEPAQPFLLYEWDL